MTRMFPRAMSGEFLSGEQYHPRPDLSHRSFLADGQRRHFAAGHGTASQGHGRDPWGLSFQQTLPDSVLGTVSYVGSKGNALLNSPMSTSSIHSTGHGPYPQFGQIAWRGNDSNSTYEGLGRGLKRAFRHKVCSSR